MKEKILVVTKYSSLILMYLSSLYIIPLIFSLIYQEGLRAIHTYVVSGVVVFLTGGVLNYLTRNVEGKLNAKIAMIITTSVWFLLSIIGAIPLVLIMKISYLDGLFESIAGFTTTGMTIFGDLTELPHSIHVWRSLMQFLGGLGILTLFLLIFSSTKTTGVWHLFGAEGHKANTERPRANVFHTVKIFWLIYGILAFAQFIIMMILGVDFFDSFCHSLTTIATGGFSIHNESVAYYYLNNYQNYILIEYVFILFMILGGINFLIHFRFVSEDKKAYFKDTETKSYFIVILISLVLVIISVYSANYVSILYSEGATIEEIIRRTLFSVVSLVTSTGYYLQDFNAFPESSKMIFLYLMLIGACVGSTSGGIKIFRTLVLRSTLSREVKKIGLPHNAVLPIKVGKTPISEDSYKRVSALFYGWLVVMFIGTVSVLFLTNLNIIEALSSVISVISNMGPVFFDPSIIVTINPIVKGLFIVIMIAGRLELLPLLVVITRSRF